MTDHQIVVSFRAVDPYLNQDEFRAKLIGTLAESFSRYGGLSIAVRTIGAGGEAVEDEGRWDRS